MQKIDLICFNFAQRNILKPKNIQLKKHKKIYELNSGFDWILALGFTRKSKLNKITTIYIYTI